MTSSLCPHDNWYHVLHPSDQCFLLASCCSGWNVSILSNANFLLWSRSHLLLLLKISPFFFLNHPWASQIIPVIIQTCQKHTKHHPSLKQKLLSWCHSLSSPSHSIFVRLYCKAPQRVIQWLLTHLHILFSSCKPLPLAPSTQAPALKRYHETHWGGAGEVHVAQLTDPRFKRFVTVDLYLSPLDFPHLLNFLPIYWLLILSLLHVPFPSWSQTVFTPFSSLTYNASFDEPSTFKALNNIYNR